MRTKQLLSATITGLALLASLPATAQTWSITITSTHEVQTSDLQRSAPNPITDSQATVQVNCQTASDCNQVGLQLESNGTAFQTLGRMPAGSNTFPVPAAPVAGTVADLAVTFQGQKIDSFQITAVNSAGATTPATTGNAGTTGTAAQTGSAPSLGEMITTVCPSRTFSVAYGIEDDQGQIVVNPAGKARAQGEVVVTPTGNVLARNVDTFDENDTLNVTVYGDARLLPILSPDFSPEKS